MSTARTGSRLRPADAKSRGLVLGAGGVLGAAWAVGAMCAVERELGLRLGDFDYIVGTSAGSVLAALVGAGATPAQMRDHQRGHDLAGGPLAGLFWDYDGATGGPRPGLPRFGVGSPRLLASNVRRLRRLPPTAVMAGLLPQGRGSLAAIGRLVDAVTLPDDWSPHPGVWIMAMNYETGRRVAFGRPDYARPRLAEAVMASCSIPGWFAPVTINGERYVDGGACSATSVDVLAGLGLDEVMVVAPMVSFSFDAPDALITRLERGWRQRVTRRCLREAAKLRREGTRVTVLGPGAEDLSVMGHNVMDGARRLAVLETAERTSLAALRAMRDSGFDDDLAHTG